MPQPEPQAVLEPQALADYVISYHYQLAGEYQTALDRRRAAVNLDDDSPYLWWSLSDLYFLSALTGNNPDQLEEVFRQARTAAERAIALDPGNLDAHLTLLRIATAQGEFAKAIELTTKLLELDPENQEIQLELVKLYLTERQMELATKTLDNLLTTNPLMAEAWSLRGAVLEEQKLYKEAEQAYRRAATLDPTTVTYILQLADLFGVQGRVADLEALLVEYLVVNPAAHEVRYRLGSLYHIIGKFEQAHQHLRVLMAHPYYAQLVAIKLAQLEIQRGEFRQALAYLDSYRPSTDERKRIDLMRAYCHERLTEWAAAEQLYQKLLEEDSQEIELALAWFRTMQRQGKAEVALDRITNEAKTEPSPYRERVLGNCLSMMGRHDEALTVFQTAVARYPQDTGLRFDLAVAWENRQRFDLAISQIEAVLAIDPENSAAHNFIGYLLTDRNLELDRAYTHIQKAVEQEPDNGAYVDSLGWWYFRKGDLPNAIKELERAIALEKDPTIALHLGDAYYAIGDTQRAVALWRMALELRDSDEVRKRLTDAGVSLTPDEN